MTHSLELKRDCDAVQIPGGTPVILPTGTMVKITLDLGGSYTVETEVGLFRISNGNPGCHTGRTGRGKSRVGRSQELLRSGNSH
jgi:hypothetical protein